MENLIDIERKVKEIMDRNFHGYKFSLMGDPEDENVQLIRLYDVEDEDVKSFRSKLWDIIEEHLENVGVSFIPSVVSHTNTEKFYADRLRMKSYVFIDETDLSLHGEIVEQIKRFMDNSGFHAEVKYDFPRGYLSSFDNSKITEFEFSEDGGCGNGRKEFSKAA